MKKKSLREHVICKVAVSVVLALDKHKKRIVTIASLFGYLFDERQRDKALETRLARVMDLASNSNSLTLPLIYHNVIWRDIENTANMEDINIARQSILKKKNKILTLHEAKHYADMFLAVMPTYLFYDTMDIVKRDITHLFESLPFILGEKNIQYT